MTSFRLSGSKINHRQSIINLLLQHGSLSRNNLAQYTHFSKPTVSQITADLIDEGVLREVGYGESTGGRRPMMLRLGGNGKLVVGIEIDPQTSMAVLTDLDGRIIQRQSIPTQWSNWQAMVHTLVTVIRDLLAPYDHNTLMGVGVAVPGVVDTDGDIIRYAMGLDWDSTPLRSALEAELRVPVIVMDRGKSAALGTVWLENRVTHGNLINIYLGSGVGGGIILQNQLYPGVTHTAGEIGHMTIVRDGPQCKCGNRGCLETLVSCSAIETRVRALVRAGHVSVLNTWTNNQPEHMTLAMLARAAVENDSLALRILHETTEYLAIALANLINILNPQTIVLGGPVLDGWHDLLIEQVADKVHGRALSTPTQVVQIKFSPDYEQAVTLGAAVLVIQKADEFLAIPHGGN